MDKAAYIRAATEKFFKGPPTPPSWLDVEDPDLLGDLSPPPPVYHYTTAAGFAGIVESKGNLHATHSCFLNDTNEIRYGYAIVDEVIEELRPELGAAYDLLKAKMNELHREDSFIVCFSKRHDVLSQWRAYANDCTGYCIGFRPKPMQERYYHSMTWVRYSMECRYGNDAVKTIAKERMSRKIARIAQHMATDPQWAGERDRYLALELSMVAWRYAHFAKHEHFRDEQE
jgi:hypothetical protein